MKNRIKNQEGVALVIALIILLVLTLIGISSISTTVYEASISGNERVGTAAFYASDAGIQHGVNKLPDTSPIPSTALGSESYYWSGSPGDKNSPTSSMALGKHLRAGFDTNWEFKRFQINASGESYSAIKEIEVQVSYGPTGAGTTYNN